MDEGLLPRTLESSIVRANRQFPALMLTGPRQVGKTTLLEVLARRGGGPARRYVTLDNPMMLRLAREEPALFLQRLPPPLLIDEVQYAPGLFPLIKQAVDVHGGKGLYWLTGSQPFHLMQQVTESLAGRVAILHLQGLSLAESLGQGGAVKPFVPGTKPGGNVTPAGPALSWLYERIWRGAFPALHASVDDPVDHDLFYGSYLQTYLQRDVRDLAQVGDLTAFVRFLRSAAARTGQQLNMADMPRDSGVAPNTAKHWLSVLAASGIVWLLEPHHSNLSKRLVKAPKLYFLDTGLAAYLAGWSSPATLEAGAMSGAFLETWVLAEMLRSWWHSGRQADFRYYRDKDQREIDVLIERDGRVHPVEIRKTAQPGRDSVRHFAALESLGLKVGHGAVVCLTQEVVPLTPQVDAVPAWCVA